MWLDGNFVVLWLVIVDKARRGVNVYLKEGFVVVVVVEARTMGQFLTTLYTRETEGFAFHNCSRDEKIYCNKNLLKMIFEYHSSNVAF